MESPRTAAEVVAQHGREFARLRGLLEQVARRFVANYKQEYEVEPTGSLLSSGVRSDLARVVQDEADSGVLIEVHGENCIRLLLFDLEWTVPLRSRPKIERPKEDEEQGRFYERDDLQGSTPNPEYEAGVPVLFWRFEAGELKHFSLARVRDLENLGAFCNIIEEVSITGGVVPLQRKAAGGSNEEDDLGDMVGPRVSDEPRSEQQLGEKESEESDERRDAAPGEDE